MGHSSSASFFVALPAKIPHSLSIHLMFLRPISKILHSQIKPSDKESIRGGEQSSNTRRGGRRYPGVKRLMKDMGEMKDKGSIKNE